MAHHRVLAHDAHAERRLAILARCL
jgi:hypothetical protein